MVYVVNQVIYCVSMALLAIVRAPWAAFLFSATAGMEYSTLFTLPFILVANYHSTDTVRRDWFPGLIHSEQSDIVCLEGIYLFLFVSNCHSEIVIVNFVERESILYSKKSKHSHCKE